MASGIAIAQECVDAHKEINDRQLNTIILKATDDLKQIVVEKKFQDPKGNIEEAWKEIISSLREDDCRYIISDFLVQETPTVTKSKIVCISWNPENAPIRSKMYVTLYYILPSFPF